MPFLAFLLIGLAGSAVVGLLTAFPHRLVVLRLSVTTAARFFPTAVNLVDCRPGSALGFLVRHASLFVTLLYVLGLSFLFVGVLRFVSAWHLFLPIVQQLAVQMPYRPREFAPVGWQSTSAGGIISG